VKINKAIGNNKSLSFISITANLGYCATDLRTIGSAGYSPVPARVATGRVAGVVRNDKSSGTTGGLTATCRTSKLNAVVAVTRPTNAILTARLGVITPRRG
jgi:hypothetical protein